MLANSSSEAASVLGGKNSKLNVVGWAWKISRMCIGWSTFAGHLWRLADRTGRETFKILGVLAKWEPTSSAHCLRETSSLPPEVDGLRGRFGAARRQPSPSRLHGQ